MTTAKDLINELVALRAEREELDAREAFLKDQLQGGWLEFELAENDLLTTWYRKILTIFLDLSF